MIILRKATHEDKEAISNISKTIWDGNDYLPNIFDKWVEEPQGEFTIAEVDGVVRGCAKFTVHSSGEYWLEGIRVDGNTRGQGIGKKITEYYVQKAKELGYDTLSLSTHIENRESINIIERYGFQRTVGIKLFYMDEKIDIEHVRDYEKVTSIEEIRHIFETREMKARKAFLAFDWTFRKAKEDFVQELIEEGSVYCLKEDGKVVSTIFLSDRYSKDNELSINYMDGQEYYQEGIKFAIKKYLEGGYDGLLFMCPTLGSMTQSAYDSELKYWEDIPENVFIYEYL